MHKVNLFQKHLFLHQLTHNMTKDCSLNYEFSLWKFQGQNMLCTQIVFVLIFRTIYEHNMFWAWNFHVLNWWFKEQSVVICTYCVLASDNHLPVSLTLHQESQESQAPQEPETLKLRFFRCPMCNNPYREKSEVELHIIGTHNMTIDMLKTMVTCGAIKIIEETFQ